MARMRSLNLIIIFVNCKTPITIEHRLNLEYYSKVIHTFQGHHSNIVFLYTHADYADYHHSNTDNLVMMEYRHKVFSRIFRSYKLSTGQRSHNLYDDSDALIELYPSFTIDMSNRRKATPRCMMLNTIRDILKLAASNPPSVLDTSKSNLERVWTILYPDAFERILATTQATLEGRQGVSQLVNEDEDYTDYFRD
ncbi:hypothetical protein BGZ74_006189, partial [Mortierella antarctica]